MAITVTASSTSQIAPHTPTSSRSTVSGDRRSCVCVCSHQQLVCAALFWFDDSTTPSLVVIEQFSRLTRNRLEA